MISRVFLIVFLLAAIPCAAQTLPSVTTKVKGLVKHDGFMTWYGDTMQNRCYLLINHWKDPFLYQTSLPYGLGSNDVGLDRGKLGETRLVQFVREGRKVFLLQPNLQYRAITNDVNERKAVAQSFAQSILWGFEAIAQSGNDVLVDATEWLQSDGLQVVSTLAEMKQGSFKVDPSRSALYFAHCKSFPDNTELEAMLTFINETGDAGALVRSVTPSPEAITLHLRHSLIRLPPAGYKPRVFDPRSSFINLSYYDYATPVTDPLEKHVIIRHRLEKRDKRAAVSEPVNPIVYYLDNGTPEPIRTALLEGAAWWNEAFEAAGFRNAFQVKLLPEGADPMDVRYNMINWVHRSTRGWSYGASVIDPRTGEIIKGHVTLGSLRVRQDYLIFTALLSPFADTISRDNPMLAAALNRLRQLSAHEVGHTIGLMHNYASSINNRASVMDYPHPLVRVNDSGKIDIGKAYDLGIGAWDKTAINWGYREFAEGTDEAMALNRILEDAHTRGLRFISDRDARAPGGLHADAHLWDNGMDAVQELQDVMKTRKVALANFSAAAVPKGAPTAMLEDALVPLYFYHRYQLEAVTKWIGGGRYTYQLRGDNQPPLVWLPADEQLRAMKAIIQCMAPDVLEVPQQLQLLIAPRPAGYSFSNELFKKRTGLSLDLLAPAETAADLPLSFLFVPERLNRLAQQKPVTAFGADDMMKLLIDSTWKAPRRSGLQKLIQQQTEQVLLTYLLAASVQENNSYAVKGQVLQVLQRLKEYITESEKQAAAEDKPHFLLALERMKSPAAAKPTLHKQPPPGAPIGCSDH